MASPFELSIFIKSPSLSAPLSLSSVPVETTILKLKLRVLSQLGTNESTIPLESIRVIYAGRLVKDGERIVDFTDKFETPTDNATFHFVFMIPPPSRLTSSSPPTLLPNAVSTTESLPVDTLPTVATPTPPAQSTATSVPAQVLRHRNVSNSSTATSTADRPTTVELQRIVSSCATAGCQLLMHNGILYVIHPYPSQLNTLPHMYSPYLCQMQMQHQISNFNPNSPQHVFQQHLYAQPIQMLQPAEAPRPTPTEMEPQAARQSIARQAGIQRLNVLGLIMKLCFFSWVFTRHTSWVRSIIVYIVAIMIFLFQSGHIRVFRRQISTQPPQMPQPPEGVADVTLTTNQQPTPSSQAPPHSSTATRPLSEIPQIVASLFSSLVPGGVPEDHAGNAAALIAAQQAQERERPGVAVAGAAEVGIAGGL